MLNILGGIVFGLALFWALIAITELPQILRRQLRPEFMMLRNRVRQAQLAGEIDRSPRYEWLLWKIDMVLLHPGIFSLRWLQGKAEDAKRGAPEELNAYEREFAGLMVRHISMSSWRALLTMRMRRSLPDGRIFFSQHGTEPW